MTEVPWLQPYPDQLLEPIAPSDAEPDAAVVARRRSSWPGRDAASPAPTAGGADPARRAGLVGAGDRDTARPQRAAVKSALQRARSALEEHLPQRRMDWSPSESPTAEERAVLQRFMAASERADMTALAALIREDAWQTMPPHREWFPGREAMLTMWAAWAMTAPRPGQGWQPAPTDSRRSRTTSVPATCVPGLQSRRVAHRGRSHRGDHHLQRRSVPCLRPAVDAVVTDLARPFATRASIPAGPLRRASCALR